MRTKTSRRKIEWNHYKLRKADTLVIVLLHVLAAYSLLYLNYETCLLLIGMWIFSGMLGITVGYHRMTCHKSFKTFPLIRAIHLYAAASAFQRGPISWARHHLKHHQCSDQEDDPYFPHYGFWFCHMGWVLFKKIKKDHKRFIVPKFVTEDKLNKIFEKYHLLFFTSSLIILYMMGGIPFVMVGGFLRIVLVLHCTWLVNSWSHRFGYQNFNSHDESSNSFFVALLTFGEGWHNNHHSYPRSAKHGYKAWEIDLSYAWIRLLDKLGLVWKVQKFNTQNDNVSFKTSKAI